MPRGRHFALADVDVGRVIALVDTDDLVQFISNEIEENYREEWYADTDSAWDAIHRAFSGELVYEIQTPLNGVILGGTALYGGDDYVVSFKSPDQVRAINDALRSVTREEFEMGYRRIDPESYGFPLSDEDLDYSWDWLGQLRPFYARAAAAGRAVIFTVDQ